MRERRQARCLGASGAALGDRSVRLLHEALRDLGVEEVEGVADDEPVEEDPGAEAIGNGRCVKEEGSLHPVGAGALYNEERSDEHEESKRKGGELVARQQARRHRDAA